MKKVLAVVLVGLFVGGLSAQAGVVTNQGKVITVNLLSETANAGTIVKDLSTIPIQGGDRRGMIVAECKITASTTGTVDISLEDVPKGAILLPGAIEIKTAVTPATSTNSLAIGGVTVLATGVTLGTTGLAAVAGTLGQTTSADKLALVITGSAATNGNFTVYIPYILGNAQ